MKNQRKILEKPPFFGKIKFFKKFFKNLLTNDEKGCIIDKLNTARPVGQAVKTLASHAENMGSIPVRVTNDRKHHESGAFLFFCRWLTRTLIEPTLKISDFQNRGRITASSSPVETLYDEADSRTLVDGTPKGVPFVFVATPYTHHPPPGAFFKIHIRRAK